MRLLILSDLHQEFEPVALPEVEADVVVLAGDIGLRHRGLDWAMERFPDTPILYVLGNHEFYGAAIPRLVEKLRERASGTLVHLLENDRVEIASVSFVGCTLWTDFRLFGDPRRASLEAGARMTDYRRIRISPRYRRLSPGDTTSFHLRSRRWLQESLATARATSRTVVVVTHHAPSRRSLHPATRSQLVSAAYASDLEDLVEESRVKLWIHGHIHRASDYEIGATRVICNPRGYPDEPDTGFNPGLVIDI